MDNAGAVKKKSFVVSDIHAYYSALYQTLTDNGFFEDGSNRLILLGDALDRGEGGAELIEFMLKLHREGRLVYIRGNHEDLLEDALDDIRVGGGVRYVASPGSHHYRNGTYKTLLELSGFDGDEALRHPYSLIEAVRSSDYYKTLLRSAVDKYELGDYIFTHGWIPTTADGGYDPYWRQAEREAWRRARWSNGMLMHRNGCVVRGKTVVVGHYHTSFGHALLDKRGSEWGMDAVFTPYRAQGIIAIDACTAYTGKVNCLVFEGTQEISAHDGGKE